MQHASWRLLAAGVVAGGFITAGLVAQEPNPAQTSPTVAATPAELSPPLATQTIVGDLRHPWSAAFLPDGGVLITERVGYLNHVTADGSRLTRVAGLPRDLKVSGQAGLFEVLLAPDFEESRQLYLSYAAETGQGNVVRLMRAKLSDPAASGPLRLLEPEVLFSSEPAVMSNRNLGGKLRWHPDGTLLLSVGDFFREAEAQNLSNHLGTIVRLNADGSVPADNPFVETPNARPEIYTYGNRNVQGMAVHPTLNEVWFHEHGPQGGDELNRLVKGGNYGWPKATYGIAYSGATITTRTTVPGALESVAHWTPSIAPSGMIFYTGDKIPAWQGDILMGALAGQHVRRVAIESKFVTGEERLLSDLGVRIRDVVQGPQGFVYVLTDEPDGALLRLRARR